MTARDSAAVVRDWHDAVNRRDVDAVTALCTDDVEVTGPRGTGRGRDLLRAWLERSGIALEPQEPLVERDGRVVVHERAQWRTTADAPAQAPVDQPADTWVVFEVRDGLVSAVRRYATVDQVPRPGDAPPA